MIYDYDSKEIVDFTKQISFNLIGGLKYNVTYSFCGTDDPERFATNEKLMKEHAIDWEYLHEEISYTYNKQGFRSNIDFDNIDFSDKIVVIGCSHVEGVGNPENQTLCHYIQESLGSPVINLGVSGGGNRQIFYNALWLLLNNPPKRMIIFWSYVHRLDFFSRNGLDYYNLRFDDDAKKPGYDVKSTPWDAPFLNHSVWKIDDEMFAYPEHQITELTINKNILNTLHKKIYGNNLVNLSLWDEKCPFYDDRWHVRVSEDKNIFREQYIKQLNPSWENMIKVKKVFLKEYLKLYSARDIMALSSHEIKKWFSNPKFHVRTKGHFGKRENQIACEIAIEEIKKGA